MTAFLAVYDPADRRLSYSRAGHEPPLVRDPGSTTGSVHRLDAVGGVPLGMLDHVEYEEATIEMAPGRTLLLYTDGITDARDPDGDMFGIDRVERALARCAGGPESIVKSITDPLARHAADVRPGDDQTIIAIRADAA